jgi:3-mercaptopyruvate sulfurtransferase SseA
VALRLKQKGFERVRPLAGGLHAWRALGYPVELVALPPETDVPLTPPAPVSAGGNP